jgi:hypothetical protein
MKKSKKKLTPLAEIRQSQLLSTYGPGAMVDLPDHSVVIGGLTYWKGDRPWLGANAREECWACAIDKSGNIVNTEKPEYNRLLVRSASNAYFTQTLSVISIPDADAELKKVVDRYYEEDLQYAEDLDEIKKELRKPKFADLAQFGAQTVWAEIQRRKNGQVISPKSIKQVEIEALLSCPEEMGRESPNEEFHASKRKLDANNFNPALLAYNVKGHGAIDMMARMTNDTFAESAITSRSTQQFQDLFKGVEFTPVQKANAVQIKKIYDSLIHRAIAISREVEQAPGLKIVATNSQGQQIEIVGLAEKKHPNLFDDRKLDITIVENKSPYNKARNKWIAIAPVLDEDGKPKLKINGQQERKHLGYISEVSLQQFPGSIKQFDSFKNLTAYVVPGLAASQVRAAFKQVKEFAATTRESIPDSEKEAVASAMWQISTASKEDPERGFKKTSAAFAIFGEELVGRLDKLQFSEFAVVGTHKPSNEHLGRTWVGEKVECYIEQAPDPANPTQNKRWLLAEGKKLGVFRSESAQLPIGTSFAAEITCPSSASVVITSTKGNQLKVGQLKKYGFAERKWNGEEVAITIKVASSSKAITSIALVDDKPLGVIDKESFQLLSEKLNVRGIQVQGFKFQGTLESAPATIANIKVDPVTIRYPQVWNREVPLVKENQITLLDDLKVIVKDKYQQKNNQGLLHDEAASLGVVPVKSEYFESFLQEKGKSIEVFKNLSDEIDKKFGVESLLGIARKENIEELYFCVTVPTEVSQQRAAARINDTLNFPLEYDQLENGRRTKFIAMPLATISVGGASPEENGIALDELQEIIDRLQSKVQKPATQQAEIKASAQKQSDRSTKGNMPTGHPISERTETSTIDTHQTKPVQREEWEKQMLKLALAAATPEGSIACLKDNPTNAGEEMQTGIFGNPKYRVIHYTPSQMLRIVDEENHRGTLYKVHRGEPTQVCEFTLEEKKSFELSKVKLDTHLGNSTPKGLEKE